MRLLRLIVALVVAGGLALLPVAISAAMAHAAKSEMSATVSGDDCPCCDGAALDTCPLVCCHLPAIAVEGWAMPKSPSARLVDGKANALPAFLARPDPPPPRA